ncbi:hypothetical protein [Pseudomonas sp. NBRC 111139]|uniref:hypothetical protein n=1 Tax=Pseudomonas sp. NBRC 111139 TaxID=1661054 RepID=UPI0008635C1F|nr:hypothetical protein [Pseudomonas sp. NBRC 111139]
MLPRFVIIPAVPIEEKSFRIGSRFYAETISGGFDIYDNQKKERLKPSFPTKEEAELACQKKNHE